MKYLDNNLDRQTDWDIGTTVYLLLCFSPYILLLNGYPVFSMLSSAVLGLIGFPLYIIANRKGEETGGLKLAILLAVLPGILLLILASVLWVIIFRGFYEL